MAKFLEALDLRETALPRIIIDWTNGHALFSEAHPGYVQIEGAGAGGDGAGSEGNPIFVQFPDAFEVKLDDGWTIAVQTTNGGSDHSWVVPDDQIWQPLFLGVKLVSTATAGNRELQVEVEHAAMLFDVVLARAGAVQAASTTRYYMFAAGVPDLTAMRGTAVADFLSTPLPVTTILQGADRFRVWDKAAIAAALDTMTTWFQYAWKEA